MTLPDADITFRLIDVGRTFGTTDRPVQALADITIDVPAGSVVIVLGPSGSGKSSLLRILSLLDRPSRGVLRYCGQDTGRWSTDEATLVRRAAIGSVTADDDTLPMLSVRENIALPLQIAGRHPVETRRRVDDLVQQLALAALQHRRAGGLSSGERQRVALAMAMAKIPATLICDEPTARLDSAQAQQVFGLLRGFHHETGATLIVSTHDERLVDPSDRCVRLLDGRIAADNRPPAAADTQLQVAGTPRPSRR